jgi:preprotein translocase subunit SecE
VAEKIQKEKKTKAIMVWYRATVGELRKVTWPTPRDAWRLTRIVLIVVAAMSALLGTLDWVFSTLVTLLVS